MTNTLLKPPARFSHAMLLVLTIVITLGLATAIDQHPAVYVALVVIGLFLAGFWAFSHRSVALRVAGTVLVQVGALGILVTGLWVLVGSLSATSSADIIARIAITLALIGAIVAVLGDLVPARVGNQDGPTIVALLYGAGLATGLVVGITAVQLGVTSLFGASTASLLGAMGESFIELAATNPITRVGSLGMLAGVGLWALHRLARLPLSRRLSQGLAIRWQVATAEPDEPVITGAEPIEEDDRDKPTFMKVLGLGPRWALAARVLSAVLFYLGGAAAVLALTPELQPGAKTHPISRTIGSFLGASTAPHGWLVSLLLVFAALRIVHVVAWRGVNIEWAASSRRLGYLGGSCVLLLGAGATGRPIVAFLLDTPALQLVPMGDADPIIVTTETGVRLAESGLSGFALQPRPDIFESWFGGLIAVIGPTVVGFALLAIALTFSIVILIAAVMAAAGARLTHPATGIGLLFVGAAGAAAIGVGETIAFVIGAGALLAWELYTYGGSLNSQLDPHASTLTAELVHLGLSVLLIGLAVVLTLLATRAVRLVPGPQAQWQVVGALMLSLAGLMLGLLYLGLRGDQSPTVADTD